MPNPLTEYRNKFDPPMKQAALARAIKAPRITVSRWESGERKIGRKYLTKLVEVTGIPAKELRPDLFKQHQKMFGAAQ